MQKFGIQILRVSICWAGHVFGDPVSVSPEDIRSDHIYDNSDKKIIIFSLDYHLLKLMNFH